MRKKTKAPDLHLSQTELDELKERIAGRQLSDQDFETLAKLIAFVLQIRSILEKRTFAIKGLLRRMFGLKTEKQPTTTAKKPSAGSTKNSSGNAAPPTKGRNGRDAYPGAKKIHVCHPDLKSGDTCPECKKGRLSETEPAVDYHWQGHAPLELSIYLLQRLICHYCKSTFTAPTPEGVDIKTVDHSADDWVPGRCDANARANATVACMRYEYGIPNYRLAKLQGQKGLALPEATQWRMIQQVYVSGAPIFEELIKVAAQGNLLQNDDTRMAVQDIIKLALSPPKQGEKKSPRKATRTTAILSHTEGRKIVLYFTGSAVAGENLARVLEHRLEALEIPHLMCDGLFQQNLPGEDHPVIEANCLDHGRRKFYEPYEAGHKKLEYVLDLFGKIYQADAEAKELGLSPDERLEYHQKHSALPAQELSDWMEKQISERIEEPNGVIGGAIKYCLKRWEKMTMFLKVPGMPLSNAETERKIKDIVRHRKNSLHYKTQHGALTGDVIMTLAGNCQIIGENSFEYLSAIQEHRPKVLANPGAWLPWNFRQNF